MLTEIWERTLKSLGLFGAYEAAGYFVTGKLWPANSATFLYWSLAGLVVLGVYWVVVLQRPPKPKAPELPAAPGASSSAIPEPQTKSHMRKLSLTRQPSGSVYIVLNGDQNKSSGLFAHFDKRNGLDVLAFPDSGPIRVWRVEKPGASAVFLEIPVSGSSSRAAIEAVVSALRGRWWARAWEALRNWSGGREAQSSKLRGIVAVCLAKHLLARDSRQPIAEITNAVDSLTSQLGVSPPLYLLLRGAEALGSGSDQEHEFSHFHKWASRLDSAQRLAVVGMTLDPATPESTWVDEFDEWLSGLADQRLEIMEREIDVSHRCQLYEYPREWRKRRIQFASMLNALAAPKELPGPGRSGDSGAGRCVRGVYLFGTTINSADDASVEHSAVFSEMVSVRPVFLEGMVRDVLLGDGYKRFTPKYIGVGIRGTMLAIGLLASLLGVYVAKAFREDATLFSRASRAITAAENGNHSSLQDLKSILELIPSSSESWLDFRPTMLTPLREAYFKRFDTQFLAKLVPKLEASLGSEPGSLPISDAYPLYRMIHKGCAVEETSVVEALLKEYSATDDGQKEHFKFYAQVLHSMGKSQLPTAIRRDERETLLAGAQSQAASALDPETELHNLKKVVATQPLFVAIGGPGTSAALAFRSIYGEPQRVDGFWGREGKKRLDEYLNGGAKSTAGDCNLRRRASDPASLRELYDQKRLQQWKDFIRNHHVVDGFGSATQTADSLRKLAGRDSPLLAILSIAGDNTEGIKSFESVKKIAGDVDSPISPHIMPYLKALEVLAGALEGWHPDDDSSRTRIREAITEARNSVGQLEREVPGVDGLRAFLEEPIKRCNGFGTAIDPTLRTNGAIVGFCASWNTLRSKLPFNRRSGLAASRAEVERILHPESGALYTLEKDLRAAPLDVVIPKSVWDMWNGIDAWSKHLIPRAGRSTFRVSLRADGIGRLSMSLNGQTKAGPGPHTFEWPGPEPDAAATISAGNAPFVYGGPWALYRLISSSEPAADGRVLIRGLKAEGAGSTTPVLKDDGTPGYIELKFDDFQTLRAVPACPPPGGLARKR